MNTHFHAWIRHLNIQWNKNIQTECYILLSKLQTKCYTSSAKKKRTCLSRSTNTLASSRQRNHEERRQKRFFLSSWAHFAEGALRRAKLENKRVGSFFSPTRNLQNTLAPNANRDFFCCYCSNSDRILQKEQIQNAKRKIFFSYFSLSWNVIEDASTKRKARFFLFFFFRSHFAKRK